MISTLLTALTWAFVAFVAVAMVLLARNSTRGLSLLQHRVDLLPQAMLVRYGGLGVLAIVAALFNAPRLLFAMLLAFAVIGLGDAVVYRRAGHAFWLHAAVGALAGLGAVAAFFALP